MSRFDSDAAPTLWQRLRAGKNTQRSQRSMPHTDLVVAGGLALYFSALPLGYLVLWAVKNRKREIGPNASEAELKQLNNAKVLAQASLVMFWLVWAMLFSGIMGHPVRQNTGSVAVPAQHQGIAQH